jgi:uncharacterized protein DUF4234
MVETNPYAPPKARVADGAEVPGLKRRSVWLMILFTFVTFGLYYLIWFFRRRPGLNRLDSPSKLPLWPLLSLAAWWVVQLVVAIVTGDRPIEDVLGGAVAIALFVFQFAIGITMIVQCVKVKNMIEDHAAPPAGSSMFAEHVQLSGIMTFFFSIFYLQWAINRYVLPATPR